MEMLFMGKHTVVISVDLRTLELSGCLARRRPDRALALGARAFAVRGIRRSGSSLLEVAPGCRLPRHTDSAEETIVVLSGTAGVCAAEDRVDLPAGGLAVVPKFPTR